MSHQKLTRNERVKLFLSEYYTGNTAYTNTIRIIGGPLVIGCGIYLYNEPARFAISYGGFCFVYGIYYLIKPLLIVILRPALFQTTEFDLVIDDNKLEIQESGATLTFQFNSFKSILRLQHCYSVKLPGKMTMFLKSNQLSEHELSILNNHLTAQHPCPNGPTPTTTSR